MVSRGSQGVWVTLPDGTVKASDMRLRILQGLRPTQGGFDYDELPLDVELPEGRVRVERRADSDELDMTIDIPVASTGLVLAEVEPDSDSAPRIEVPDLGEASALGRRAADAVAFIARHPFQLVGGLGPPELIPEGEGDGQLLAELGTNRVKQTMTARMAMTSRLPLSAENIEALCERPSAIRLYADALRMGTASGKLRELWKIFERRSAR
jgi:hypothetical protein